MGRQRGGLCGALLVWLLAACAPAPSPAPQEQHAGADATAMFEAALNRYADQLVAANAGQLLGHAPAEVAQVQPRTYRLHFQTRDLDQWLPMLPGESAFSHRERLNRVWEQTFCTTHIVELLAASSVTMIHGVVEDAASGTPLLFAGCIGQP